MFSDIFCDEYPSRHIHVESQKINIRANIQKRCYNAIFLTFNDNFQTEIEEQLKGTKIISCKKSLKWGSAMTIFLAIEADLVCNIKLNDVVRLVLGLLKSKIIEPI